MEKRDRGSIINTIGNKSFLRRRSYLIVVGVWDFTRKGKGEVRVYLVGESNATTVQKGEEVRQIGPSTIKSS